MSFTKPLAAAAVLMALAVPASALTANATTDLNLRAGPGNMYPIQGVIASSAEVDVQGCIAGSEWCKVTYNGTEGWAYSAYLTSTYESNPVVVYDNMQRLNLQEIDPVNIDSNPAKTFTPSGALILGQRLARRQRRGGRSSRSISTAKSWSAPVSRKTSRSTRFRIRPINTST